MGAFENTWAWGVLALGVFLFLFEIWRRRQIKAWLVFRLLWILALTFVLLQWSRNEEVKWSQPERLSLYIDQSDSVVQNEERWQRIETIKSFFERWSKDNKVPLQVSSFSESVRGPSDKGGLRTFIRPVEEDAREARGTVVVASDGLWSDRARFSKPVFTINLSEGSEKDIWIESLNPVVTAFLKNRVQIPFAVAHQGFAGKKVRASLWRGAEKIDEKEIHLSHERVEDSFSYFPDKMGEQVFVLKLQGLDGELSNLNNEHPFTLRTVRDKIRILHVCGKPSQDLKAWRMFLTRQPDVDLVSFYILRTLNDYPDAKNSELSLIPFPYEELFSTELDRFDVVILQNFDFSLYFPSFYLSNLAQFIRRGGGLMMVGGDQSFDRYQDTPLESTFPFTFNHRSLFEESRDLRLGQVLKDPLTEGLELALRSQDWTARHGIRSRSGAIDLATYSTGEPMWSVMSIDKGRVLAINSDELWKLQQKPTKDPTALGRLLRRSLQYLTFDPDVERKKIQSGPWKVGKEVLLSSLKSEKGDWTIRSIAFRDFEIRFHGVSQIQFTPPFAGAYEVSFGSQGDRMVFVTEEQPWRGEWKHVLGDAQKLRRLASDSGASYFEFDEFEKITREPITGQQMIASRSVAWDKINQNLAWIVLILSLIFLCIDFYFRKKERWDL